jgi:peptidoglycan/xylan/chitin deacetylase (PgdA/CDA1 family)
MKATFFILTEKINSKTKPLLKRMVLEGHTIASHHEDHENNNTKSLELYRAELTKSIKTIAQILEEVNAPHREIYYRFPYGAYGGKGLSYHHFNVMKEVSQELFGDNCINFAFWDIDSLDWLAPMSQSDVISNIMANIIGGKAYDMKKNWLTGKLTKKSYILNHPEGGGVVLMHDIHARSVETLVPLLEKLKNEGVEVKPLNEVEEYSYHGKECRLKN